MCRGKRKSDEGQGYDGTVTFDETGTERLRFPPSWGSGGGAGRVEEDPVEPRAASSSAEAFPRATGMMLPA